MRAANRLTLMILCAAVIFGLVGCGYSRIAVAQSPATTGVVDRSGCHSFGARGAGVIGVRRAAGTIAAQMRVFRRSTLPTDHVPLDAFGTPVFDTTLAGPHGRPYISDARLLLGTGRDESVYAIPTSRGGVCWAALNRTDASCTETFNYEYVDPGGPRACSPPTIWGIVPNGVVAVDVFLNRRKHRARIGTNAFMYRAVRDSGDAVNAIVLWYTNRSKFVSRYTRWQPPADALKHP